MITASFSQKKIVGIALQKISETINTPVEIEDLSFTFIKRFPFATIELSGVKIGAVGTSHANEKGQSKEDILNIKNVFVSVKTIPLLKGEFEVIRLEIADAALNYKVDSTGYSNIEYLMDTYLKTETTTISDSTNVMAALYLRNVKLKRLEVNYSNDSAQISAVAYIPSLDIEGKIADEKFIGTLEGDIQLATCSYPNTNLYKMEKATFDFKIDYKSDTVQFLKLKANVDENQMNISGKIAFATDLFVDLKFDSKEFEIGNLMKFTPDTLLETYGIKDIKGIINLSGTVKGIVSDSILPAVDLAIKFKNGSIKTKDYPEVKKLSFESEISNGAKRNNKTTNLIFKSIHAETDSSKVDLSLTVNNIDKPKYSLKSKLKINIGEFKSLIPDTLFKDISGVINAEISTYGVMPDSIDDNFINLLSNNSTAKVSFSRINADMDSLVIKDFSGSAIYRPRHLEMSNLNGSVPTYNLDFTNSSFNAELTGLITQPQNMNILLSAFYAETQMGKIWGSANIKKLKQLDFNLNVDAKINLLEIKPFLPDTLVKNLSGSLAAKFKTHGKLNLDSIAEQANDIIFNQSEFMFDAKNISLSMFDSLPNINDLNCVAKMGHDTIFISEMNGTAAGVHFSIDSTTILNVYNSVIKNKNEKVVVYGNFDFGVVDYSVLSPFIPGDNVDNSKQKTATTNKLATEGNANETRNFQFEIRGKFSAKSFKYEKILLENISAKFNVCDSVYIVDQFKSNAFDGSTNSSVRYSLSKNNRQIINVRNHIDNMDIYKLLYAFDNFGQDSLISYENINGIFSADLNSRVVFEADTMVSNDLRVMGNFKLENGKLINYKPAMDVSNFTGIKELDNIEMKTLESDIFMFKNKIYVPITNIVSSSMDLSTFGMQSMSDDYEYHIKLNLGEILRGKSQKLFERQSRSGDEVSKDDLDKNTIKLIYAYIDGKKKVGFATKKAQRQMALKIQVQQTMLELIFHPNLVSFETGVK